MAESISTTDTRAKDAARKLEPSLSGFEDMPADASSAAPAEEAPASEPAGFGQTLRTARESQGISLGDMAVQCRLSVAQLRALEEETLENLPEPVYVRAFIRGYAQALRIDSKPLVEDYMARYGRRGASVEVGQLPARAPSSEAVFHEAPRNRTLKIVLFAVLAALAAGGIWAVYTDQFSNLHSESEAQKIEAGESEAQPAGAAAEQPAASQAQPAAASEQNLPQQPAAPQPQEPAQTSQAPAAPAPAPAAPAEASQAAAPSQETAEEGLHKVEFRLGAGSSWVQVISPGGRNVVAAEMRPQSVQTYDIPKGSRFTIGNSSVVTVTIDGAPYSLEHTVRNGIARFTIE